jgi:hypothetical protein
VISIVVVCRISKDGKLLAIREISDVYRYIPFDMEKIFR